MNDKFEKEFSWVGYVPGDESFEESFNAGGYIKVEDFQEMLQDMTYHDEEDCKLDCNPDKDIKPIKRKVTMKFILEDVED